MSLFSDLNDYKLHTEFRTNPNILLHRSYRADRAHGRPRVVIQEEWVPQKPPLGVGQFGIVRLEQRQKIDGDTSPGHKERAVKQLRKIDLDRMRVDFRKELQALTKFSRSKFAQSQAFVEFFGWFEDDDHVYLAMEYFPNGTLDHFITKGLLEHDAQIIGQQLLEGLRIMHQEQFTHRDLKPQNIFVVQQSPYWWVKIGDFGISKRAAKDDTVLRTSTGTPLYLAPEVFHYLPFQDEETDTYTNAVDIWSFACVLYEMLALQVPFTDWPRNLVGFCHGAPFPDGPLIDRVSTMAIDFVQSVLVPAPEKRPTAQGALGAEWFQTEISVSARKYASHTTHQDSVETNQKTFSGETTTESRTLTIRQENKRSSVTNKEGSPDTFSLRVSEAIKVKTGAPEPETGNMSSDDYYTSVRNAILTVNGKEVDKSDQLSTTVDGSGGVLYPHGCTICNRPVVGDHYYCSMCNFTICKGCRQMGYHCSSQDHWMAKTRVEDNWTIQSNTQTIHTGWFLGRTDGKVEDEPSFSLPSQRRRWTKSYKPLSAKEAPYDYCFQCGITFPSNDPPNRHVWELHGTVDVPTTFIPTKIAPTTSMLIWMKGATPEEQEIHDEKMKKLETECNMVFKQKVEEKETKMKEAEEELYARHRELKHQLEQQRSDLQQKISRLKMLQDTGLATKKKKTRFGLW